MNEANTAKLAELTAKYGDVAHIESRAGQLFVFQCPTLEQWEEFQDKLSKEGRSVSFRQLAQETLVFPDLPVLQAFFAKQPAVIPKIADKLAELAGADLEVTVKKG